MLGETNLLFCNTILLDTIASQCYSSITVKLQPLSMSVKWKHTVAFLVYWNKHHGEHLGYSGIQALCCTGHNALSLQDTTLRSKRTLTFPKNASSPRLDMPRNRNTHIEKTNTQARNKFFFFELSAGMWAQPAWRCDTKEQLQGIYHRKKRCLDSLKMTLLQWWTAWRPRSFAGLHHSQLAKHCHCVDGSVNVAHSKF